MFFTFFFKSRAIGCKNLRTFNRRRLFFCFFHKKKNIALLCKKKKILPMSACPRLLVPLAPSGLHDCTPSQGTNYSEIDSYTSYTCRVIQTTDYIGTFLYSECCACSLRRRSTYQNDERFKNKMGSKPNTSLNPKAGGRKRITR